MATIVVVRTHAQVEDDTEIETIDMDEVTDAEAEAEAAAAETRRLLKARRNPSDLFAGIRLESEDSVLLPMINVTSCTLRDGAQLLPLHQALADKRSEAVILRMVEVYPDSLKVKGPHGELPLHLALEFGASEAVIEQMIHLYREALTEEDDDGHLPLHTLFTSGAAGASTAVIARLIKEHPEALKGETKRGWTPDQLAEEAGQEAAVVQLRAAKEEL